MKTTAASAAALNVAAGGSGDVVAGSGDEGNEVSTGEEVKHEKNWTKLLQTDEQTILCVAKRAQEMESMAMSKYQEVMLTGKTTSGVRERMESRNTRVFSKVTRTKMSGRSRHLRTERHC